MIRFKCGSCNKSYKAPSKFAGKKVRCQKCGNVMVAPLAVPTAVLPKPLPSTYGELSERFRADNGDCRSGDFSSSAHEKTQIPETSMSEEHDPNKGASNHGQSERIPCPTCAEMVMPNATVCIHCKRPILAKTPTDNSNAIAMNAGAAVAAFVVLFFVLWIAITAISVKGGDFLYDRAMEKSKRDTQQLMREIRNW